MKIITKNKYFFANDTNCSKTIFKDIDFHEHPAFLLITKKQRIIQRKSLHEEVGNLFKRILFDCISLPEYIKARKKDDNMCDLTHKKNESQHSKQLNKGKEKIKATQSNPFENEWSNLLASLEIFSDDFLEDGRQQLIIQERENFQFYS